MLENLYKSLIAVNSNDFNTCFYCGDDSVSEDYVPPIKQSKNHIHNIDADFLKVPSCSECSDFLKNNTSPYFSEHIEIAKQGIKKRYAKALHIFEVWNSKEASELDYSLQKSINAGLKLGEESYKRYKYKGFTYEVDGEKVNEDETPQDEIYIFGELFYDFKDALDYASYTYQIPPQKLKKLLNESVNDFDAAIRKYQEELNKSLEKNNRRKQCLDIADKTLDVTLEEVNPSKLCLDISEEYGIPIDILDKKLGKTSASLTNKEIDKLIKTIQIEFFPEYRDFIFFIMGQGVNSAKTFASAYEKNKDCYERDDIPKKPSKVYQRSWKTISQDTKYYDGLNLDCDYILDSINYISYEMIKDHIEISQSDLKIFLRDNEIYSSSDYEVFLLEIDGYDSVNCFPEYVDSTLFDS